MASAAGANLRRIARELRSFPRVSVADGLAKLRKATSKNLAGDTGGDRRLSHASGRELKIRSSILDGGEIVRGELHAGGPIAEWTWLEEGTQPHGGHPGTRALRTWSGAQAPIIEQLATDQRARWQRILRG